MASSSILSDRELVSLTSSFQLEEYSKDRALDLVASGCLSMITEPGDRMAGALARSLGKLELLSLLVDGLETKAVVSALRDAGQLDYCQQIFGDLASTLSDSRQRWLPRMSKSRLEHMFLRSEALGLKLLTSEDPLWPKGLLDLQDAAPSLLFVEGSPSSLLQLTGAVSIVGSRAASPYGVQVTTSLVKKLALAGRATVSGGALGIDAEVHRCSINEKLSTFAVMAGGMDRKYPSANFALFQKIQADGALLSELPPGVAPTRWRFLQRNRLIAALTPVTVVIEAGIRSGSIRTANNALELDRELYAVPGSVFSGTSRGTNSLIADSKALALHDLDQFATGQSDSPVGQIESSVAKRAQDAVREIGFPTRVEIGKLAGLTSLELDIAIQELTAGNKLIEDRNREGVLHYALRHGL